VNAYTHLTHDELLRLAHAEHNALTSTPLETELLRRLEFLQDEAADAAPLLDVLDEHNVEDAKALTEVLGRAPLADLRECTQLLAEADLLDPSELARALKLYKAAAECF
jgi:hypothetical protein